METVDVEIASAEEKKTLNGVSGPLIVIGRADGSGVVLKHDDVSRKHASVELADGGMVVRDLSTNGTCVDGRRVMGAQKLPFGKPIQVGPFTIRIRPTGAPAAVRAVAGGIEARASAAPPSGASQPLVVAEGAVVVERAEFKGESVPPPASRKPHAAPRVVTAPARAAQTTLPAKPAPIAAARESGGGSGGGA